MDPATITKGGGLFRDPTPHLLFPNTSPRLSLIFLLLSLSPFLVSPALSLRVAPAYHQKLQGWSQVLHEARDPDRIAAKNLHMEELRPLLDLTSSQLYDAFLTAASSGSGDVWGEAAVTLEQNETLSELCKNHTLALLTAVGNKEAWALQMVDAMGKPSFGIMDGNVIWPGGYSQCLKVRANTTVVSQPYFSGRYCNIYSKNPPILMSLLSPAVTLGACVPDTCSSTDIKVLVNIVLMTLNVSSQQPVVECHEDRTINAKAVVAIVICSIIGCLMLVGTLVDIICIQRPQWAVTQVNGEILPDQIAGDGHTNHINPEEDLLLPKHKVKASSGPPQLGVVAGLQVSVINSVFAGVVGKILVAFSVYTNGKKLLSTSQSSGSLTCVHGIRFLSMTWVVLGHTWGNPANFGMNLMPYAQQVTSKWAYQGITNATVSVDSFFVLSGLLVTYLTLKEMKNNEGKVNWFLFYFHRVWRLTPAYMLSLMVYVCLAPYWGQGPMWPKKFGDEDFCADNWWTNLLYINNFVNTKEACFGHSWYLANDMQFYILSPLIIVPIFFRPVVGIVVAWVFLLGTAITPGVLSQYYKLPPGFLQQVQGEQLDTVFMDYFTIYYFKPYNRMGAYVVGMLAGYFLYHSNCKLRINWLTNMFLWSFFTACALAVLYGLFESGNGHPLTVPVSALYNALSRQVWGACVAWVVIACVTDNGGIVNKILSWSALVPLSRLTYCVYLLHLMLLELYTFSQHTAFFMDDLNLVFLYLAMLVVAFAVAFVASLAFEAPMMGLEKIFLHPAAAKKEQKH